MPEKRKGQYKKYEINKKLKRRRSSASESDDDLSASKKPRLACSEPHDDLSANNVPRFSSSLIVLDPETCYINYTEKLNKLKSAFNRYVDMGKDIHRLCNKSASIQSIYRNPSFGHGVRLPCSKHDCEECSLGVMNALRREIMRHILILKRYNTFRPPPAKRRTPPIPTLRARSISKAKPKETARPKAKGKGEEERKPKQVPKPEKETIEPKSEPEPKSQPKPEPKRKPKSKPKAGKRH